MLQEKLGAGGSTGMRGERKCVWAGRKGSSGTVQGRVLQPKGSGHEEDGSRALPLQLGLQGQEQRVEEEGR